MNHPQMPGDPRADLKKMFKPSPSKTIIPPEGGWEEQTLYLVDVSYRPSNPVHRSVFFTGFLHGGNPAGYNEIHAPGMKGHVDLNEAHYLAVVRKLCDKSELGLQTPMRLPGELTSVTTVTT